MGITGLLPFIEKASRRTNISEFSGCTVAIDSYCWLHKGAFACADKLVRGEDTDMYIKYCMKYVTMLLSKNIKPILVFDGRHLPAKAITESKRRESRDISKKRAAELLSLGKTEEARSYIRRSVDITHAMALGLIKECRKRNVDCIVAPYEADAQLAYLNIKNIAQLVITEDSDLILFGCTKVIFKMDLDGTGTLVETAKLPLVMKCPIEHYSFNKFRQMCILSGCDYLASLPGIGLAKARQFVTATQDPNFACALRKLPSFFNKLSLVVTDEYRESFLKAEATFKHQYVYDPLERQMVRLTEPDDEDVELALCVNAGELLDPKIAFQLALGNLDPFTLKKMDDWHPDDCSKKIESVKTDSWKATGVSRYPSIWRPEFKPYIDEARPWEKKVQKVEPIIAVPSTRLRKKVVTLVSKYVPETQTQDEGLSIQSLSNMYCVEPATKKLKMDCDKQNDKLTQYTQGPLNTALVNDNSINTKEKSPVLQNKERSFRKCMKNGTYSMFKKLSSFPRTVMDNNIVESKFFSSNQQQNINNISKESTTSEDSPERVNTKPFKVMKSLSDQALNVSHRMENSERLENAQDRLENTQERLENTQERLENTQECLENAQECLENTQECLENSQKENTFLKSPKKRCSSPILEPSPRGRNPFRVKVDLPQFDSAMSEESVIENTYPMETLVTPTDSQISFGASSPKSNGILQSSSSKTVQLNGFKKSPPKSRGLKRTASLPSNQPTLLSKFGFQKKPVLKR